MTSTSCTSFWPQTTQCTNLSAASQVSASTNGCGFRHNKLFLPGKGATASIYGLMSTGKQQQVKPSKVWERLSE